MSSKNQSLIIFDLDGTLIDSRRDITEAVNHALITLGVPPFSEKKITSLVGHGLYKTVDLAIKEAQAEIDTEKAKELTREFYYNNPVVYTTIYPGVEAGLKALSSKGYNIALFTNKLKPITERILEHFQLKGYFDRIIGANAGFELKPNPEAIFHMLKEFQCKAEISFMLGDSDVDIQTGINAGVKPCLLTYGYGSYTLSADIMEAESFTDAISEIIELTRS